MKCAKCGGTINGNNRKLDGSKVGGLPGVKYAQCNACGHVTAVPARKSRKTYKGIERLFKF